MSGYMSVVSCPSTPMMPPDPRKIWVEFAPINPGEVLDVHKALLFVGTPTNRIWGDATDGSEDFIRVIEYPTPEPATVGLLALGAVAAAARRRRR